MNRRRASPTANRMLLPASLPGVHALLASAFTNAFETLGVGAALREPRQWYSIQGHLNQVLDFELAHGKEADRDSYNQRCLDNVFRERRIVLGRHAGFCDFFVPIGTEETVHAVLVAGPFATERPTSGDVLERWHWLTGRHGQPSDPEFSLYVSTTLRVLLLESEHLASFRRMLECFAMLSAGRGDARAFAAEAAGIRENLEKTRLVERMWDAARSMVDPRTSAKWLSPHSLQALEYLGAERLPEHAIVGLLVGQKDEPDAVGAILRRDAFQRACVDLARRADNTICGRIADHGVMFLAGGRLPARARDALTDLGRRAATLARRHFGLSLHLGLDSLSGTSPLGTRYEEALGAAERALSRGLSLVSAERGERPSRAPLRQLREQLSAAMGTKALVSSFERYIDAVGHYSGYRIEIAQAQLEAGFEQAARTLVSAGALDEKSRVEMYETMDRAARDASTVSELFGAYRRAVSDLVDATERPIPAAQDRNLRRAIAFIHGHFVERLSVSQVARIAGFTPGYFSQLFKKRERVTLHEYVLRLRLERARQLLVGTDLSVERVGRLSGFARRGYFHEIFKQVVGKTPAAYRNTTR